MSHEYCTTKKRKFKHINQAKRAQIEILLRQGMPKTQIAKAIGISRSTLYNELKRGTVEQLDSNLCVYTKYYYDVGQRVYEENRKNSRKPYKLAQAFEFIKYAEDQILKNKLSPDAICGQEKIKGNFKTTVSAKTLYNYISLGFLKVKNIDLPLRVRRKSKRSREREHRRILGDSITLRPDEVNERKEFGHWEIDTIVGTKDSSPVLLALDERLTRKRHIIKISSRSSKAVEEGLKKLRTLYGDNFYSVFKSITSDNGSEFSKLPEQLPNTAIYYAHPYSSFERGTNEKQNSLVRRFFPKGKSFQMISDQAISFVENWINNLPRKLFNYRSANDLFCEFFSPA